MKAFGFLAAVCLAVAALALLLAWAGAPPALAGVSAAAADLRFTVVATITVGTEPHGVTVDTANNIIYVANYISGTISVVNGSTLTPTDSIVINGGYPDGIVYNPVDGRLYVGRDRPAPQVDDVYFVITPTTKISYAVGSVYNPAGLVVSSSGAVYIANGADHDGKANVTRHEGVLIVNSGDSGTDYAQMAIDSQGKLYVTAHNAGNSGVALVGDNDTNWPKVDLTDSQGSWGIAWDPVGNRLYAAAMDGGNLAVISTTPSFTYTKVISPPETASLAMVAIDPNRRLLFVTQHQTTDCNPSTDGNPEKLYIYDLQAESWLTTTVTLGQDPDKGIAIDTDRRRLYVTNRCSNTLSVIEYGVYLYLPIIMRRF
jgi:DNA-binding beta-propeller fold protein YncE